MSDAACDWPWATFLELSVIHSLWLPLVSLGVYRKNQVAHQCWFLPALRPEEGQLNSQISQRFAFTCRLSIRLTHWNNLQLCSSSAWLKLHRVEWEGFLWLGLLLFPRLHATWKAVLWPRMMVSAVWAMVEHRDPGGWHFNYLHKATNPRIFSHGSSLLWPPFAGT